MAKFHNLQINSITKETDNAVSITFTIPEPLRSNFEFKAGQYVTLKTSIRDEEVRRDYSICTNPSSRELKVVVKAVENGTFSTHANHYLKVGDSLEVSEPNGRFVYDPASDGSSPVVAFAAGSGITPIMGIILTALQENEDSEVVLIYGNKTPKDTIFLNQLNELKSTYSDRFQIYWTFSQSNEPDALFGRIEPSTVNYVSNKIGGFQAGTSFYLCGPKDMIDQVSDTLSTKGIDKEKINFELFTVAPIEDSTIQNVPSNGMSEVTVLVDDETSTFEMPMSKTILEVALEQNVDAPYSCQGGICSSCIARLTEGEVEMRQNNILTDGEVAEGFILTCQAQPVSQKVSIDYDDV